MRHLRSRASFGALLSAAALVLGSSVKADIIPVFDSVTPNGSGGFTYSYTASVASGSRVNTGDYFTIYDFNKLISGSEVAPVGWAISEQLTGITPAGQLVPDSGSFWNVTFTYTGAASIIGPVDPIGAADAFTIDSNEGITNAGGHYTSQTHKQNPGHPDNNTLQSNQGRLVVPQGVPETSSLMLLVPGLVPLGILLRRRARKA